MITADYAQHTKYSIFLGILNWRVVLENPSSDLKTLS